MSTKLSDLAEKLNIDQVQLKKKLKELGVKLSPKARVVDDDTATLVLDELSKVSASTREANSSGDGVDIEKAPQDIAEIYDEIIAEKQEREIIKSQRKKTAGKEVSTKKEVPKESPAKPEVIISKDGIEIPDFIAVKEFAEKTGINVAKVIGELMKNGILANINQQIDFDTAQIIADDLGIKLKRLRTIAGVEELMSGDISKLITEDDPTSLKVRPPVVCVMGHVDHGKTKLLDIIRKTNVVDGEAGGITQHIGAYQVVAKGKPITFLDTPGHEAFTAMRARGAKITDIAVLVVAADEGIKPQTVEAINHAKEAGVPIIVAINKIDKPGANIDKVKGELSEQGLQPEDWGGKTVTVPVSALNGEGIDGLLDMILLTAEMGDLKANPNREAVGTVIEAHLDQNLGPVATILINTGTLKVMDNVIVGSTYGRIKLMKDFTGKALQSAIPSTPVLVAGLNITPKSGDILQVVKDERTARGRAEEISLINKKDSFERMSAANQLISRVKSNKILKIVLKADTKGSLEAIRQSLAKIKDEEVAIKIIHAGVGTITESDVMMASASEGMILAFTTDFDAPNVSKTAEREMVEVRQYKIIYNLLEDVNKILSGLMEPEIVETLLGRAELKKVFLTKKKETIIGARVLSGKMESKAKLRVVRGRNAADEENVVGEAFINSLRKAEETVDEIKEGNECGMKIISEFALQEGDILVAYKQEQRKRII
ncbi:translation initiation factor IF-2 [Candidatus Peregrinibacteria bacterium RIFCSPLOWO2_01_FULL_39_12]|nr:MAG: translation initiation factor IF-2 [Candidatus Peregrinibacteria bacterium RIFCSPLOWO2_01_FULL_39_12]